MVSRIVLVVVILLTISLNSFSAVNYSIKQESENGVLVDKIVFNISGTTVKYTIGTKTSEYVMGCLANSNTFTKLESKDVTYGVGDGAKNYTIALFSISSGTNGYVYIPDACVKWKIGFLRADDDADVIYLYADDNSLKHTFKLASNADPINILKVDYVVGQIIKWICSYDVVDAGAKAKCFYIKNITVSEGIPTKVEFENMYPE
jgi:hypothetical protein